MIEATFAGRQDFSADASDDARGATTIRTSLRRVVERALATVWGGHDTRNEVRAAAERLGDALDAHAATVSPSAPERDVRDHDATARRRAFRVMAGVRA
jgi:hypothetical protein